MWLAIPRGRDPESLGSDPCGWGQWMRKSSRRPGPCLWFSLRISLLPTQGWLMSSAWGRVAHLHKPSPWPGWGQGGAQGSHSPKEHKEQETNFLEQRAGGEPGTAPAEGGSVCPRRAGDETAVGAVAAGPWALSVFRKETDQGSSCLACGPSAGGGLACVKGSCLAGTAPSPLASVFWQAQAGPGLC